MSDQPQELVQPRSFLARTLAQTPRPATSTVMQTETYIPAMQAARRTIAALTPEALLTAQIGAEAVHDARTGRTTTTAVLTAGDVVVIHTDTRDDKSSMYVERQVHASWLDMLMGAVHSFAALLGVFVPNRARSRAQKNLPTHIQFPGASTDAWTADFCTSRTDPGGVNVFPVALAVPDVDPDAYVRDHRVGTVHCKRFRFSLKQGYAQMDHTVRPVHEYFAVGEDVCREIRTLLNRWTNTDNVTRLFLLRTAVTVVCGDSNGTIISEHPSFALIPDLGVVDSDFPRALVDTATFAVLDKCRLTKPQVDDRTGQRLVVDLRYGQAATEKHWDDFFGSLGAVDVFTVVQIVTEYTRADGGTVWSADFDIMRRIGEVEKITATVSSLAEFTGETLTNAWNFRLKFDHKGLPGVGGITASFVGDPAMRDCNVFGNLYPKGPKLGGMIPRANGNEYTGSTPQPAASHGLELEASGSSTAPVHYATASDNMPLLEQFFSKASRAEFQQPISRPEAAPASKRKRQGVPLPGALVTPEYAFGKREIGLDWKDHEFVGAPPLLALSRERKAKYLGPFPSYGEKTESCLFEEDSISRKPVWLMAAVVELYFLLHAHTMSLSNVRLVDHQREFMVRASNLLRLDLSECEVEAARYACVFASLLCFVVRTTPPTTPPTTGFCVDPTGCVRQPGPVAQQLFEAYVPKDPERLAFVFITDPRRNQYLLDDALCIKLIGTYVYAHKRHNDAKPATMKPESEFAKAYPTPEAQRGFLLEWAQFVPGMRLLRSN